MIDALTPSLRYLDEGELTEAHRIVIDAAMARPQRRVPSVARAVARRRRGAKTMRQKKLFRRSMIASMK
jgi:hypothetical protein